MCAVSRGAKQPREGPLGKSAKPVGRGRERLEWGCGKWPSGWKKQRNDNWLRPEPIHMSVLFVGFNFMKESIILVLSVFPESDTVAKT